MSMKPLIPTPENWLHILFGDERGGGHLAGQGIESKTEFPSYWSLSRIENAIISAQANVLARDGVLRASEYVELVDGILLRVVIQRTSSGALTIATAHPLRGNGVFRNISGEQVSKPLLRQDRKK